MIAVSHPQLSDVDAPDLRALQGHYSIEGGMFWFVCPGKCKSLSAIHIDGKGEAKRNWTLTDEPEGPTLKPSINHVGCWHGWLVKGEFKSCE